MPLPLPEINVFSVDSLSIILNWKVQDLDNVVKYNLYGCATYGGVYALVEGNIPNHQSYMTPGSVMAKVLRTALSIGEDQPYFFKITSVNPAGVESDIADSKFVSVDAMDDINKERLTDNYNPVYKSLSITVSTANQFVDVQRILGREANFAIITPSVDMLVRFNSSTNDTIFLKANVAQQFDRQAITISEMYFTNNGTVTIFVSGL